MKESVIQTLQPGFKLRSKERTYQIVKVLGSGSFGITYLAKADVSIGNITSSMPFAIKEHFVSASCYRGDDGTTVCAVPTAKSDVSDSLTDFITEANRLKKLCLKSRNIVSVNETIEANDTAYYVMEYLDGGTPSKCSEEEAISIILQIARALETIHKEQVLHLDLKPDNIVLKTNDRNETYPVLIDFGISKHFDSNGNPTSRLKAKGASSGYAPQEQYTEVKAFSPKYDIYALGAVLFYLCTGKNPPDAFNISPNQLELKKELEGKVSLNVGHAILGAMMPSSFERTPTIAQFCANLIGTDSSSTQNDLNSTLVIDGQSQTYENKSAEDESYSHGDSRSANTQLINLEKKGNRLERFFNSVIFKKYKKERDGHYDIYDYAKIEQQAELNSFYGWRKWIFPIMIVGTQHNDSINARSTLINLFFQKLDRFKYSDSKKILPFLIDTINEINNQLQCGSNNTALEQYSIALLCLTDIGAICINNGLTKVYQIRKGKVIYEVWDQSKATEIMLQGAISKEQCALHPWRNQSSSLIGVPSLRIQNKILSYKRGDQFVLISGEECSVFEEYSLHDNFKIPTLNFEKMNEIISQATIDSKSKLGYGLSLVTAIQHS